MSNAEAPFGENYRPEDSSGPDCEPSPVIEHLTRFLLDKDPDMRDRIEKAAADLRSPIQRLLAKETFLRLGASDDYKSVSMTVQDGLPRVIVLKLLDANMLPPVAYEKTSLTRTMSSLDYLHGSAALLNRSILEHKLGEQFRSDDVVSLQQCLKKILDFIDTLDKGRDIVARILGIDRDVLGTYFISEKRIHLYWLVIGLVAGRLKVSVESLTAVVAAHEWAHVYTHLGADAGGLAWETGSFCAASTTVVESLAQYYGGLVCESLSGRQRGCFEAYLKLLAEQPPPYRFHLGWLRDTPNKSQAEKPDDREDWDRISRPELREAVRFAVLRMRLGDSRHSDLLLEALDDGRNQLNSNGQSPERSRTR